MARYPDLPYLINVTQEETRKVYKALEKWGAALVNQLDLRDQELEGAPATNIFTVVTVTDIGRPKGEMLHTLQAAVNLKVMLVLLLLQHGKIFIND